MPEMSVAVDMAGRVGYERDNPINVRSWTVTYRPDWQQVANRAMECWITEKVLASPGALKCIGYALKHAQIDVRRWTLSLLWGRKLIGQGIDGDGFVRHWWTLGREAPSKFWAEHNARQPL